MKEKYNIELIPKICPICSFDDLDIEAIGNQKRVVCNHCHLKGPLGENKEKAIEKWNKSKKSEYCNFCGSLIPNFDYKKSNTCPECKSVFSPNFINQTNDFSVCYLDLLGFSAFTEKYSIESCVELIDYYSSILEHRSITNNFREPPKTILVR